jgi:hypothetical protein
MSAKLLAKFRDLFYQISRTPEDLDFWLHRQSDVVFDMLSFEEDSDWLACMDLWGAFFSIVFLGVLLYFKPFVLKSGQSAPEPGQVQQAQQHYNFVEFFRDRAMLALRRYAPSLFRQDVDKRLRFMLSAVVLNYTERQVYVLYWIFLSILLLIPRTIWWCLTWLLYNRTVPSVSLDTINVFINFLGFFVLYCLLNLFSLLMEFRSLWLTQKATMSTPKAPLESKKENPAKKKKGNADPKNANKDPKKNACAAWIFDHYLVTYMASMIAFAATFLLLCNYTHPASGFRWMSLKGVGAAIGYCSWIFIAFKFVSKGENRNEALTYLALSFGWAITLMSSSISKFSGFKLLTLLVKYPILPLAYGIPMILNMRIINGIRSQMRTRTLCGHAWKENQIAFFAGSLNIAVISLFRPVGRTISIFYENHEEFSRNSNIIMVLIIVTLIFIGFVIHRIYFGIWRIWELFLILRLEIRPIIVIPSVSDPSPRLECDENLLKLIKQIQDVCKPYIENWTKDNQYALMSSEEIKKELTKEWQEAKKDVNQKRTDNMEQRKIKIRKLQTYLSRAMLKEDMAVLETRITKTEMELKTMADPVLKKFYQSIVATDKAQKEMKTEKHKKESPGMFSRIRAVAISGSLALKAKMSGEPTDKKLLSSLKMMSSISALAAAPAPESEEKKESPVPPQEFEKCVWMWLRPTPDSNPSQPAAFIKYQDSDSEKIENAYTEWKYGNPKGPAELTLESLPQKQKIKFEFSETAAQVQANLVAIMATCRAQTADGKLRVFESYKNPIEVPVLTADGSPLLLDEKAVLMGCPAVQVNTDTLYNRPMIRMTETVQLGGEFDAFDQESFLNEDANVGFDQTKLCYAALNSYASFKQLKKLLSKIFKKFHFVYTYAVLIKNPSYVKTAKFPYVRMGVRIESKTAQTCVKLVTIEPIKQNKDKVSENCCSRLILVDDGEKLFELPKRKLIMPNDGFVEKKVRIKVSVYPESMFSFFKNRNDPSQQIIFYFDTGVKEFKMPLSKLLEAIKKKQDKQDKESARDELCKCFKQKIEPPVDDSPQDSPKGVSAAWEFARVLKEWKDALNRERDVVNQLADMDAKYHLVMDAVETLMIKMRDIFRSFYPDASVPSGFPAGGGAYTYAEHRREEEEGIAKEKRENQSDDSDVDEEPSDSNLDKLGKYIKQIEEILSLPEAMKATMSLLTTTGVGRSNKSIAVLALEIALEKVTDSIIRIMHDDPSWGTSVKLSLSPAFMLMVTLFGGIMVLTRIIDPLCEAKFKLDALGGLKPKA